MLTLLYLIFCGISSSEAIVRHYYIAAVEVDWDYAPTGRNLVTNDYRVFRENLENRADRIGSVYRKAIFRGFTDNTFTQPVHVPEWMGLLGPTIKAETGDFVHIHFQNWASGSNFSVHPHGFFYDKANEGAVYLDGTSGADKLEDAIPPGGNATYVWEASKLHAPTDQDDDCYAFAYHSHTLAPKDVDTGLVGIGLICRPGTLDMFGNRRNIDKEFYLYADVADENNNWYADQHVYRCGNPSLCQSLKTSENKQFIRSNQMTHINGFMYGNLPDFTACLGERVAWYFMSVNRGIHPIHINGHTMVIENKRTDTAVLHSASVYTGYMRPINLGRWLLYCRNQDHYDGGMLAFFKVNQCPELQLFKPMPTFTRRYYLAIEEVLWDYAPGIESREINGAAKFLDNVNQRIGSVYKKAMYIEYTDATFTVRKDNGAHGIHYGLAGPPIKAQVGDTVTVVVLNRASRPYSFLANGVAIDKYHEGAYYKNDRSDTQMTGAIVNPGTTREYAFCVPHYVDPMPLNSNCITYVYHSAVDFTKDIYTGLFGPLLVCKLGSLTPDGKQIGVDREFFLNWMVIDENRSWYIDDNIRRFTDNPLAVDKTDADFQLSNKMRAINGRTFGSLQGLDMCLGETVSWHMYGLGGQIDHHHFSFEGNNFMFDSRNIDTASVFAGVGRTVTMNPDQTGKLLLRNGQLGLEAEGMFAWYNVMYCTGSAQYHTPALLVPQVNGIVRRYYIGAVEGKCDYAEEKIDPVDGKSLLDPEHPGFIFVRNDPPFLGTIYDKAFYREFTDGTFTTMKQRTQEEFHLGILGPFIRGNVGDTIEIVFRNLASFPYNIVPRNVVFKDGSSMTNAPVTLPGRTQVYTYIIPERSGPNPNEPNCVGTFYVSRDAPLSDAYSGLVGPFVICKPGILDFDGQRTDQVTKEFATGFIIFDENKSNYRDFNFANIPSSIINDPDFIESNIYHSINGYIYGNLKGLDIKEGENSAWYVFGLGSSEDIHTVHYHGQLYSRRTSLALKRDVLEVFAGTYETVEMPGYNPGTWLFHCHVAEHSMEGMETVFTVHGSQSQSAFSLQGLYQLIPTSVPGILSNISQTLQPFLAQLPSLPEQLTLTSIQTRLTDLLPNVTTVRRRFGELTSTIG